MLKKIIDLMVKYPEYAMGSISALIPIFVSVFFYKNFGKSSKVFLLFCIFYILSDIPLWITAAYKIDNYNYYHIRDSFLIIFLSLIYAIRLKNRPRFFMFLILEIILFLVLFLQIAFLKSSGDFLWITRIILLALYIGFYFYLVSDLKIKGILYFPFFWHNAGVLIFVISSILISLFNAYTSVTDIAKKDTFLFYAAFLEYINLLLFIFISIGFFVSKKNAKVMAYDTR